MIFFSEYKNGSDSMDVFLVLVLTFLSLCGILIGFAFIIYASVKGGINVPVLVASVGGIMLACSIWYNEVWVSYTTTPAPLVLKGEHHLVIDNAPTSNVTFLESGFAVITQEGIDQIASVAIVERTDEEGNIVIDTITFKGDETMVFDVEEQTNCNQELSGKLTRGNNASVQALLVK